MSRKMVIGIDGGGTHTRYLAADLQGNVLSYVESGSCLLRFNPDVETMMRSAIRQAVEQAGGTLEDVLALVAGLADCDRPEDAEWAQKFTALPEMVCPRIHINDVDIAQTAAHLGKPGIVMSCGTNWASVARTESWDRVHGYCFHNNGVGAGSLAVSAITRIIAGEYGAEDQDLVAHILKHWGFGSSKQLADMMMEHPPYWASEKGAKIRQLAPIIALAAENGAPLARAVCDEAIETIDMGIRLLGSCFESDEVAVGLLGSVLRGNYILQGVIHKLGCATNKRYTVVGSPLSAAAGAVWLALEHAGIKPDESIEGNLRRHPAALHESEGLVPLTMKDGGRAK